MFFWLSPMVQLITVKKSKWPELQAADPIIEKERAINGMLCILYTYSPGSLTWETVLPTTELSLFTSVKELKIFCTDMPRAPSPKLF